MYAHPRRNQRRRVARLKEMQRLAETNKWSARNSSRFVLITARKSQASFCSSALLSRGALASRSTQIMHVRPVQMYTVCCRNVAPMTVSHDLPASVKKSEIQRLRLVAAATHCCIVAIYKNKREQKIIWTYCSVYKHGWSMNGPCELCRGPRKLMSR